MEKYYITTPIYYVNDAPHIGHAYTSIAADTVARYQKLLGKEVFFMTGTDEHGQKIARSSESQNISTKEFVDFYSSKFREMSSKLELTNDDFLRTTEERHIKAAQKLWNIIKENGYIYEDKYKGWYSVRDEAYYAESELIDGKAPTGAPVEWMEESSYFFALSKFQDRLLEFYEHNPDFIWPESRRNEVINFVKSGLQDLSVSRTSFSWGVPVPGDDKHVMYVWIEALSCYISVLGYAENEENFQRFWPADAHFVGKDIIRFHAIYWPAFLMAANLPLPKKIVAHGWWTNEGQKISKSLGNTINPYDLVEDFGLDQTRYFLLKEVPFGNDGNFARVNAVRRINSELANNIGNLVQRTLSFICKNCESTLPDKKNIDEVIHEVEELVSFYHERMENFEFNEALDAVVKIGNLANAYIDEKAPWKLRKENIEEMNHVLYHLCYMIKVTAILLQPFTPNVSKQILDFLNIAEDKRMFENTLDDLEEGIKINEPKPLFPRLEE